MTWLTVFVAGTSFGILIGAAAALAIQKRQAAADNPSTDMSFAGKPMLVIDAEVIETALRGDL